ncbi:MAG TPA: tetratricopeptide repeat protein [Polyangia bacterium]|nr:tetratricopeptide repeat protein [Polyangia bacterium]
MRCLAENTVVDLLGDKLAPETAAQTRAHVEQCADCQQLVAEAARLLQSGDALALASTAWERVHARLIDGAPPPLEPGARVGRYIVLAEIGAGGMGVVYAAHDPELDRKIALKLLRADLLPESAMADMRSRLLREAQAMARLAHPNVVTVYDAGTFGDQVFVAMEFVDGQTLGSWLRAQARPWREVLSVFLHAGRGLAAAHAAGLAHRDFKPDNVLVGEGGRVQVTDFGLARPTGPMPPRPEDAPAGSAPSSVRKSPLSITLTKTGALVGTPAYMAPEQYGGGGADTRTDQFSFCVALYEGLYGQRPFVGQTLEQLALEVAQGHVADPPPGSRVPGWLRRVVLRGMSLDPGARFPSMDALLEALERDPRKRLVRRLLIAAAAALLLLGGLGMRHLSRSSGPRCDDAGRRLAGIWDGARRNAMEQAFGASGRPFAAAALAGTARVLDDYARRWTRMHGEACEATWVRGEQSSELLDLRMQCLDQRLAEVDALVGLLTHADPELVARSVEAAQSLSPLDGCADAAALKNQVPPPRTPAMRARVDAVSKQLAQAKAMLDAGKYAQGVEVAQSAADAARQVGYRPLEADALYALGELQERAGSVKPAEATLREAVLAAEAGRNDDAAAHAWTHLIYVVGYAQMRHAEGHECARHSAAAIERLGGHQELEARRLYTDGSVYLEEGKYEQALALFQRAQPMMEQKLGPEHPFVATILDGMGLVYSSLGKNQEALTYHQRALELRERALGRDHPYVAISLNNVAGAYLGLARHEDALAAFKRALVIQEQSLGTGHTEYADSLNNVGMILTDQGKLEEALSYLQRALAVYEKAVGPEHQRVALCRTNLGNALNELGRRREALAEFQRSLAIYRKTRGEDSRDVALCWHNIATVERARGRAREALAAEQRSLDLFERSGGGELPEVVPVLGGIALAELALGQAAQAVPVLERALAQREKLEGDPSDLPDLRFHLAKALWQAQKDRVRAHKLARAAVDEYARVAPQAKRERAEVESWLRRHPLTD